MAGTGAFCRLWGLLLPEAQDYFRAIIPAFPAAVHVNVRDTVEAGKVVGHELRVFGGYASDLFTVDEDTEGGLAFPFATLYRQFHVALVVGFFLPVNSTKDRLPRTPPVFECHARNLRPEEIKAFLRIVRGLAFPRLRRRGAGRAGSRRGRRGFLLRSGRGVLLPKADKK